jgi:hypothetical protein
MPKVHTTESFKDVLAALPRGIKLSASEEVDLLFDLNEVLNIYEDNDQYFIEAVADLEKREREGTEGGRPPDSRTTTLILSLLTIYQRYVSAPVEDWEIGAAPRSNFPRFAAAALVPITPDADGGAVERIAKKWRDIRSVIAPKTP